MTLNPRIILFLSAISLQGCGGGSDSSETVHDHLISVDIQQVSQSEIAGGGKTEDELPDREVVFKAYGHYDNTDEVRDITSEVSWRSTKGCDVICPTSNAGHYHTTNPGDADVYAVKSRVDASDAESNHITKRVVDIQPYKIETKKLEKVTLTNDEVPRGLTVSYSADIYWNDGRVTTGTNEVSWQEQGDGFEQDEQQKNRFLASGDVGSDSVLTASYQGVYSDPRTLEVSNPILKELHIEVGGGQSTSVPRGQARTLIADAEFEGLGSIDVTQDVSWNSDKNPAFEQKDNTFRAIGSKSNVGEQTTITASLSGYQSEVSNEVTLSISPAELIAVRTEIDQGANALVPRYLSRTLKAIGVYRGDINRSAETFEEDITSTVASWTNSDITSFTSVSETSNRFQAIGEPGTTSLVTPDVPNFVDEKGIQLSVGDSVITSLEVEHADNNLYTPDVPFSDDVPKGQVRMFRVVATYDSASDDFVKEDVTQDAQLVLSDASFQKIDDNTVQAVGNTGEYAEVSANYRDQETDNNVTLTVKEEQSETIQVGTLIFSKPPELLLDYDDALQYCSARGEEIPRRDQLEKLVNEYVGPNHGWPWSSNEGYGTYWSNEQANNNFPDSHWIINLKDKHPYPRGNDTTNQVSCVVSET
ncbi:hypothetical protein [Vibrio sp. L3-7]|uniref:hypothetical protein n=1 Tax=Vibrio sp. L3-7 TaxID=2912253 RepID=UPI001F41D526|nr:hypothetical protein [Vibrio sp. L3-7]MCF7507168.1 hypothetical protein [Vibrio sp. L3-7]